MQWALSSEQIDMAIICKEAAKKFVEYDENFEIVDTVVQNSDVFLVKNENIKKVGVTQNRNYQIDLVKEYYESAKEVPFISGGLAYALESDKVDAIVIDSIKALSLNGKKFSTAINKDYDTYVMVVNKSFKQNKLYTQFIKLYNQSVKELNDENLFKKELEKYTDTEISEEVWGEFKKWNLKFLQIQK